MENQNISSNEIKDLSLKIRKAMEVYHKLCSTD